MIPGHTKFKYNGSFRLIKKLYHKIMVDCVDHVVNMVKRSSIAGLNKVQHYNSKDGFQYFDIISGLKTYFKKLPGLQKFQHFIFTNANPGVIKIQEIVNDIFQEFKLLKINKSTDNKILEKIRALSFSTLVPPPMKHEQQDYLYQNICPFVNDEYKDIICPKPININVKFFILLN